MTKSHSVYLILFQNFLLREYRENTTAFEPHKRKDDGKTGYVDPTGYALVCNDGIPNPINHGDYGNSIWYYGNLPILVGI